ncbi:hypothetical protein [Butyrivibrio sp. WCD2001]|uniref:hypothetical protein n=1 Tax=Butyrivibrio sp. WCD2001 TaxID=1280681 RepID=UPI0003FA20E0|nr:hypothetical protein [Butyrivibrio sp. WCD2001]
MSKFQNTFFGFFLVNLFTLLIFLAVFNFKYPIRYENMGGDNIWQSASTVKYVNIWLEEGAAKMHFTACENYRSIEFQSFNDRVPFISYPSGHIVLVWLCAVLSGRSFINISFVKHLQMILFAIESLLFSSFIFVLFWKHRIGSNLSRILISVSTVALWMLLPVNAWYLPNVFFTDQSVLLYVMLFLFLEELLYMPELRAKKPLMIFIRVFHFVTIYLGILTDYYFWILAFFVFVMRIIGLILDKKSLRDTVICGLSYAVPVVLALITFLVQLSFVDGWLDTLKYKLKFRTGGDDSLSVIVSRLIENFTSAFTQEQRSFMFYLFLFQFVTVVIAFLTLKKGARIKALFTNTDISLVIASYIAVAFQILLLKNHSAVHEFSMMKAGWCVAMTAPIAAVAYERAVTAGKDAEGGTFFLGRRIAPLIPAFAIALFIMILITGVPTSTSKYIVSRDGDADYTLDEFLYRNTDYNDVCFSFTNEIHYEPPMDLTISHERVYLVDSADEIDTKFPDLDSNAVKLLLIDTAAMDKNPELKDIVMPLIRESKIRAKQDNYVLYELP